MAQLNVSGGIQNDGIKMNDRQNSPFDKGKVSLNLPFLDIWKGFIETLDMQNIVKRMGRRNLSTLRQHKNYFSSINCSFSYREHHFYQCLTDLTLCQQCYYLKI